MQIFNLTQHLSTKTQLDVVEPSKEVKEKIKNLLTFKEQPDLKELNKRATALAKLIPTGIRNVLIGGASYFMPVLHRQLVNYGYYPHYSFSPRVSKDIPQKDGTVKKVSKHQHLGYVSYN